MTVAELLIKELAALGVSRIYGVPGEETEDLQYALAELPGIEFIPCRHEQGAAFMAATSGRLTGVPGVCLSTLGPGATNLVTGVGDAYLDHCPLIVLTAQKPLDQWHYESHQLIDVQRLMEPVTKASFVIYDAAQTVSIVQNSFRLTCQDKPGPVHIELPENIASQKVKATISKHKTIFPPSANEDFSDAHEILKNAKRPIVLIGHGAYRASASTDIFNLIEDFKIPFVTTIKGKGVVSDAHPFALGVVGLGFKDICNFALEESDCVIVIGYDVVECNPISWNHGQAKKLIVFEQSSEPTTSNFQSEVIYLGALSKNIYNFNKYLKDERFKSFANWSEPYAVQRQSELNNADLYTADHPNLPHVLQILNDEQPENAIVISDVGAHKIWIARNHIAQHPHSSIISNGFASMGIALPTAIAAAELEPDKVVIALGGDGGSMMNIQELETAKRLKANLTYIIFEDNDYGLISWKQEKDHEKSVGTKFSKVDWPMLVQSFGLKAVRTETLSVFRAALNEAINNNGLTVIVVPIVVQVNAELNQRLKALWNNRSSITISDEQSALTGSEGL